MMSNIAYRFRPMQQRVIFFLTGLLLCISCIREDIQECTGEVILYIQVTDAVTGADLTRAGEVGILDLYFFNQDGHFMEHMTVSSDTIERGIPVSVLLRSTEEVWISAWGNLLGNQVVSETSHGCMMDDLSIVLHKDEEGFSTCPDSLFFGISRINTSITESGVYVERLPVSQKNARMNITVRGLPRDADASDYYFTICRGNSGYDFRGNPIRDSIEMKQHGIFHDNYDLRTPNSFNLVHVLSSDHCMIINLHENRTIKSSSVVFSISQDSDGNQISPIAGHTTNVLIDLVQGTPVNISVKVTPWDEVYQWASW